MTGAQAFGLLAEAYFDGRELTPQERAEVTEQIEPQCRFMKDGTIANLATMSTHFERMLWKKEHPQPVLEYVPPGEFDYDD